MYLVKFAPGFYLPATNDGKFDAPNLRSNLTPSKCYATLNLISKEQK
ncbi:hypothetical protein [Campylobacter sp.]